MFLVAVLGIMSERNKQRVQQVMDKAWEIFPVPLLMTDLEVRVQFYTMSHEDTPRRHIANGVKNCATGKCEIMFAKGERKRLMSEYHMTSNALYRYLNQELQKTICMMEQCPEKYMQIVH